MSKGIDKITLVEAERGYNDCVLAAGGDNVSLPEINHAVTQRLFKEGDLFHHFDGKVYRFITVSRSYKDVIVLHDGDLSAGEKVTEHFVNPWNFNQFSKVMRGKDIIARNSHYVRYDVRDFVRANLVQAGDVFNFIRGDYDQTVLFVDKDGCAFFESLNGLGVANTGDDGKVIFHWVYQDNYRPARTITRNGKVLAARHFKELEEQE